MTEITHGVLVTYKRIDLLADHLERLADQTSPLTTLLVVDNADDGAVRELVQGPAGQAAAARGTRYLTTGNNSGPAGGFTAGIADVLTRGADDDFVVLLDDNDPPRTKTVFADTRAVFGSLRSASDRVGGVGSWGAALRHGGRLRMATATTPEQVDYLAGGGCPHYRVEALRTVGGPDPSLFFGFEELDLGRALARAGWSIWSSGLAREHGWAEMMTKTQARALVEAPTWRRYYSVRNLVTVLRKDGRLLDAIVVSLTAGLGKPLLNLLTRPRAAWANLRLTVPAVVDAWRGRLGRRVEPVGL